MHRVDKDEIQKFAARKLVICAGLENEPNGVLHLYRNLCFSFVGHGFKDGRIETAKTRRGVRDYLAQKKDKVCYSGSRFASYIRDLERAGLVALHENKLVVNVPEGAVRVGEYTSVNLAIKVVSRHGLFNLTTELLEQMGVTVEDVIDAAHAIEQLLPDPANKKQIRSKLQKVLADSERTQASV